MGKKQSRGTCVYCGKALSKSGISKHLATCKERKQAVTKANQKKTPKQEETLYHLRIQDAYRTDFWLNLEMRGSKKLKDLDDYLRAIWLECCGHLSEFSLAPFQHKIGMSRSMNDVFASTEQFVHVYDFGTSSETVVKLVAVREGKPLTNKPIFLMARNNPPTEICIECGKPATHLCIECMYEEETWGTLCDKHAEIHPHHNYGEPMLLMNSPRVGMCGYEGPAEPPY